MNKQKHLSRCLLNGVLIVLLSHMGLAWGNAGIDEVQTVLQPADFTITQIGRTIYQAQCAACHGAELQGQTEDWQKPDASSRLPAPPHDKTGHTWHHSDDLLFEITKYGPAAAAQMPEYQSNMPAYEAILSDAEIIAVLSYIKSTWPKKEREWQDNLNFATQNADQLFNNSTNDYLLKKLTAQPTAEAPGDKHNHQTKSETAPQETDSQ